MTGIVETLGGWIQEVILAIGYPGIVFLMAAENIFPPVPSEFVLPFAGALSARDELIFWGVGAAGTAGSVIGALVLYAVGYFAREAGVRRIVVSYGKYAFISENDLDRATVWFERYGEFAIVFGRLIPIIRSIISIPAGYTRMNLLKFLLYTTFGTFIWSLIQVYMGWVLGENWQTITEITEPYQNATLILMVLIVVGFFGWRAYKWRKRRNA
ncbi:MAG: DedA family protein [Dehalococcoidia bacterium]|nr:DedA family protein [Dehalococcoidia bacterium]